MDAFYKNSYFNPGVTATYHSSYSEDEIKYKENRASATVRFIASNSNKRVLRFLDIGAGEAVVREASDFEWKVKEVDFQLEPCLASNEALAEFFEVANPMGFLDNCPILYVGYDVICLQNVIEHVRDPEALTRLAKKHLASERCLFIQVLNDFSDLHKFCIDWKFFNEEYWESPPQHLSYFKKEPLENFLKAEGFNCHDLFLDFSIELLLCGSKDN